ncbi:Arrestin homolog [Eumeta japonica]|uniref:Arrestin homolog n=1 Tax=Eumeta variegata TaxID=151549 RepID=A0A4C1Z110_EUMVA|nr:Arrestin homolog [Eumeta japonica]
MDAEIGIRTESRYGREDEEVMGLKFCNEAIMSLAQIWPQHCNHEREPNTPLQDALIKRLGANAYPFHLELTPLAPPSVQLVPAKQYHGAPIGTSYDVRAYIVCTREDCTVLSYEMALKIFDICPKLDTNKGVVAEYLVERHRNCCAVEEEVTKKNAARGKSESSID